MKLKVLTYNIHKGLSWNNARVVLEDVREVIQASQADIVCLQEVVGEHAVHRERFEDWFEPQLEFLADGLWTEFAYAKNVAYPEHHHGNAILSRFPIEHWENRDISTNPLETRGLLYGRIRAPDWPHAMHVLCTHLNLSPFLGYQSQLKLIYERMKDIPGAEPVILAGDFNDWHGRADKFFTEDLKLKEVFHAVTGRRARTFPSRLPLLQLDRIYVRGLDIESVKEVIDERVSRLSDHIPLQCVVEFKV